MKLFHYIIKENEITESQGEIHTVPADFIEYRASMMGERIFYKVKNGEVCEVIAEGGDASNAERRADEFLAGFNVNISLGMP